VTSQPSLYHTQFGEAPLCLRSGNAHKLPSNSLEGLYTKLKYTQLTCQFSKTLDPLYDVS